MQIIELTNEERALLRDLPVCRPVYGDGGMAVDEEGARPLIRALFNMGAMGCDARTVCSLVTKVLDAFPAEGTR